MEETTLEYFVGAHGTPMITDSKGIVAEVYGHEDADAEAVKELAKKIVLTHNTHDELVRAVEYLLTTINRHAPHLMEHQMETQFAQAVLKKIKQ